MSIIKTITKHSFELELGKESLTLQQIVELNKKKQLANPDYLFTLEGVLKLNHFTFRGAWKMSKIFDELTHEWHLRKGKQIADEIILNAGK